MSVQLPRDVQIIENHIDAACQKNPLISKGRELAIWNYLTLCEDILFRNMNEISPGNPQLASAVTDDLTNVMKFPLRWIREYCKPTGHYSTNHTDNYIAAWKLHQLAGEYLSFETAFIYARAGRITLRAVGDNLLYEGWAEDMRYEAYDRLLSCETYAPMANRDPKLLCNQVANSVSVAGERFKYTLSPQLVQLAREILLPVESIVHRLPRSWKLPKYNYGQFQDIASTLRAIALTHFLARCSAASKGCIRMGVRDAVLIMSHEELSTRLRRYTNIPIETIEDVISDLTFGNAGIKSPDPSLQPLVQLTHDKIAICPSLWMSIDAERNFCVLCNRMPQTRQLYSTLSEDRSKLMCERLRKDLASTGFRFWSGGIPGHPELPDVDLAIISENDNLCFLIELKSYIAPAEPREIEDRSKEIAKGISQVKLLRQFQIHNPQAFMSLLHLGPGASYHFLVASDNSIGSHHVQDLTVPVVNASNLVRRLLAEGAFATSEWLTDRNYLPILGKDFEVKRVENRVDGKTLLWYGIKPLIHRPFF